MPRLQFSLDLCDSPETHRLDPGIDQAESMIFEHPFLLTLMSAFAAFVMSLTGFGYGLVSMGAYANVMSVADANLLATVLSIIVIVVNLAPLRRSVRWRLLLPIFAAAAVGIPIGVYVLVLIDERILKIALGVVILAVVGVNQLSVGSEVRKPNIPAAAAAGLVSGAMGGAFAIGGLPMTLYLSGVLQDKRELKANQLLYLLVTMSARVPLLVAGSGVSRDLVITGGVLLVPVAIGIAGGIWAYSRMSSVWVRRVVQMLLAISAILLIVRSI